MHSEIVQLKALLEALYFRHHCQVAFVDESYRQVGRNEELPFYTVTANLIPIEHFEQLRIEYVRVAGGSWWHTTDAYQKG